MRREQMRFRFLFLFLLWTLVFSNHPASAKNDDLQPLEANKEMVVAIVRDGPSADLDEFSERVKTALDPIARTEYLVRFKESPKFSARWNAIQARRALQNAMNDRQVDLVFAMGALVTQAAMQPSVKLTKPVVARPTLDAYMIGLPYTQQNRSSKKNLNFVVLLHRDYRNLTIFQQMIGFRKIHFLIDGKLLSGIKQLSPGLHRLEKRLAIKISPVALGDSAAELLAKLPEDTEAVYLTPPLRMNETEKEKLISGINARKIRSFSQSGQRDVERGVLAAQAPISSEGAAHRIALHLHQVMTGISPNNLPVAERTEMQLVINSRTASEIGYHPTMEVKLSAEFIEGDSAPQGSPLTMADAMRIAADNNIDLAIQRDQVETSLQDSNRARSRMLPQIEGSLDFQKIDEDRAASSFGATPMEETLIGVGAHQMIYDDSIVSNYRSSRKMYESTRYNEQTTTLDIMEQAAVRYLDYLAARAIVVTEKENLKLTRSNLELARIRYQVGIAGPEEVYRWEANVDSQKASVLTAKSREEQARVALNQTLGVDQRMHWAPEDIKLETDQIYFMDDRLKPLLQNGAQTEAFRSFATLLAFENEPLLKSIDQRIEAQQISLGQLKRRFVLPSFNTSFRYDHKLSSKDAEDSSESFFAGLGSSSFPEFDTDNNEWAWTVSATLPLFEGGLRFHDVAKARSELSRLGNSLTRQKQLIEQNVRSAIYAIESSQPNIRLSRQAAKSAKQNLEVVHDKYARGTVPIIDLLDAQNRAFVAEQQSIIADYTYLKDLISFQRSIAWFESTKTETEKEQLAARFRAFLDKQ